MPSNRLSSARFSVLAAFFSLAVLLFSPVAHANVFDVDTTFGSHGLAVTPAGTGNWTALALLPDGRFVAAGQNSTTGTPIVARFSADGALDPTFAASSPLPGVVTVSPVDAASPNTLIVLPDGRILLGATTISSTTSSPSMLIARLTADGALDPTFGAAGVRLHGTDQRLGGIALDPTGRIIAAGYSTVSPLNGLVERFTADGAYDPTFHQSISLGSTTRFNAIGVDGGGRVVVAGTRIVSTVAVTQSLVVERLTAVGAPDAAFGTAGVANPQIDGAPVAGYAVEGRKLLLDSTGSVLVTATATSGSSDHRIALAKLTTAGVLDTSFGTGGTRSQNVSPAGVSDAADLTKLPGGGIAVAGSMKVGPTTQFALAGYLADGAVDGSLNPANAIFPNANNLAFGVGGSDRAAAMVLTPAGRLIVAGYSLGVHDAQEGVIVRLGGPAGAPQATIHTNWGQARQGRKVRPGQTVSFDASASTSPNAAITKYEWDLDGNGSFDATGAKVDTTYPLTNKYGVLLKVTNADGLSSTTGTTVDVEADQPPNVHFSINDPEPAAGIAAVFHVVGSDNDGEVASYAFDLDGNGSFETDTGLKTSASKTFTAKGTQSVGVRVTDDEGVTATATRTVTIKPGACETTPQVKIGKATIVRQTGEGCFHRVVADKDKVRTTTWTTNGLFRVNGIQLQGTNGVDITIRWKQKLSSNSPNATPGDTISLNFSAPRAVRVTGVSGGTPFFFHIGALNWDLSGDTIVGFGIDPSAQLSGLPLKIQGGVRLNADGTSSIDVLPGLPQELLGKTPTKFKTTVFGPTASLTAHGPHGSRAELAAFSFTVDEIPLGVVTLGPVTITYDGHGGWHIAAKAKIPPPIAATIDGDLEIVNGKVKSLSLNYDGIIPTPTPIQVNHIGMSIDFGPKVTANPHCVKTVGLVETTPYETYKVLDYYAPFLRPIVVAHPELYGGLFRKTYLNYPTPNFALCGSIGLTMGDLADGLIEFGYARYPNPKPNYLFLQGTLTLVKLIKAKVTAEVTTDGYVHFRAGVAGGYPNETNPWITWDLGLDFEYYKKKFNAEAWAVIGIPPIGFTISANLLASSKGIAACVSIGTPFGTWRPGAGAKWGESPTLYFSGCDVKDYKEFIKSPLAGDIVIGDIVAKQNAAKKLGVGRDGIPLVSSEPVTGHGNDAKLVRIAGTPATLAKRQELKARLAQAAPTALEIPKDLPGTVLTFKGAGAPPHLILHSPTGEVFDTGSGNEAVNQPTFVAVKNTKDGITEALLAKPAAGTWTVETAPDSSRLVQALQADGTAGATVKGHAGGSGQARTLSYDVQDLPEGAHVEFVEAGIGGAQIGSATKDGSGKLSFQPAIGGAGKRELQAIIYAKDGYISRRLVLDTYEAPTMVAPKSASRLKVKQSGKKLVIRWTADPSTTSQQLDFKTSAGINVSRTLKRSQTTMPMPAAGSKLKISVTATGRGGLAGKPKTFTIRLPKAKKKAKR